MPNPPEPAAASTATPVAPVPTADEMQRHNEWFTTTVDPWREIALLEFGGDRTAATTVERMVTNAEPAQRLALETKLLEVLARSELTDASRLFVCRMLGLIGSKASVAAVASLLLDDRTADVARLALDSIPGDEVNATYRAALGKLSGAPLAGLIGSVAARGDGGARDVLTKIAIDPTQSRVVREAAERAVENLSVPAQ